MKIFSRNPCGCSAPGIAGWLAALALAAAMQAAGAAEPFSAAAATERQEMRAQLTPRRYTTLAAEIGARINRLEFKEGERFGQGERLVEFECSIQTAQHERALAQQYAARNVLTGNRRLADLNAIGGVELRNAEAEMQKADAEAAFSKATLEKCAIAAPFPGRVAEQKIREQQFAQPGQLLLEILDDSTLEIEFIAPTRWLAWLKSGYAFKVRVDDTGKTYPARVQRVGARADPVSQTVKAVAVIDGQFSELLAGMSGGVLIAQPGKTKP